MLLAALALVLPGVVADYPVQPVPFTAVTLTDRFWAPRMEVNRTVTIPFAFEKCVETGRVALFDRAAAALRGEEIDRRAPGYPFDDTDVYKVLEGASYSLSVKPDPALDAYLDELIAKIAAAQEPDGYLYTTRTINPKEPHAWAGKERWELEEHDSHELYNLGHLFEAAVAHYQATGKRSLLDVAIRSADLLVATFGPGKKKIWPGHQITEMGLAKMYRATGKQEYLEVAEFLLASRGGSGEYWQAHKPVLEQDEAVGHAVRGAYMFSGMADVAAMAGDRRYLNAIDKLWDNVVGKKLYITGGIGATGAGEAFGRNYELPNMSAYAETCAAIGNVYWNHRLFLLHKDAKYIDVLERTLYNGVLSGVSLDGKSFFYPNPLESTGQHGRSPWFGVACCPSNMTRFLSSVPGYMYAVDGDTVYVNLYAEGTASIDAGGGKVQITQKTEFPWDGAVRLSFESQSRQPVAVKLRIPGWARNEAVPSDLYRFAQHLDAAPQVRVNGAVVRPQLDRGYVTLNRVWRTGDVVELSLPMPARQVAAHPMVHANAGRLAVQRGPIVYCAEWPDNDGQVRNVVLPHGASLAPVRRNDLLGGVTVVRASAQALSYRDDGSIERTPRDLVLIPYYSWANRGRGDMAVWLASADTVARPTPRPTLASRSTIRTSEGGQGPRSINDLSKPLDARDQATPFFHWWPKKGTTEWVEMTLPEATTVSESTVYWFDDTGRGECRVPESWTLLYRDGNEWKPVRASGPFGVDKDANNRVTFQPVRTTALRIEVKFQPNWSSGLYEWEVK
jgi:uncharacterized protein